MGWTRRDEQGEMRPGPDGVDLGTNGQIILPQLPHLKYHFACLFYTIPVPDVSSF